MSEGKALVNADRCSLFLVDAAASQLITLVFDKHNNKYSFKFATGSAARKATGLRLPMGQVRNREEFEIETNKRGGKKGGGRLL